MEDTRSTFENRGIILHSLVVPISSPVAIQNPVLDTKAVATKLVTAGIQSSKDSTTRPFSYSIARPVKKSGQTATRHTVHFAKAPGAR